MRHRFSGKVKHALLAGPHLGISWDAHLALRNGLVWQTEHLRALLALHRTDPGLRSLCQLNLLHGDLALHLLLSLLLLLTPLLDCGLLLWYGLLWKCRLWRGCSDRRPLRLLLSGLLRLLRQLRSLAKCLRRSLGIWCLLLRWRLLLLLRLCHRWLVLALGWLFLLALTSLLLLLRTCHGRRSGHCVCQRARGDRHRG